MPLVKSLLSLYCPAPIPPSSRRNSHELPLSAATLFQLNLRSYFFFVTAARFNRPCHPTFLESSRKTSTNNAELELGLFSMLTTRVPLSLVEASSNNIGQFAGSGIVLKAVQALAVKGAKVYVVGRMEENWETLAST